MTQKRPGERLFDALGDIPEEMLLTAERDGLQETEAEAAESGIKLHGGEEGTEKKNTAVEKKRIFSKKQLGGILKYLPVAVCICLVAGAGWYVVSGAFFQKRSAGDAASSAVQEGVSMDNGAAEESVQDSMQEESGETAGAGDAGSGAYDGGSQLPARYDPYEGPVFAMTVTGDDQNLRSSRSLACAVTAEGESPLLQIADTYRIKNTSEEDKTVQLVYPFVTTLNLADGAGRDILDIEGQETSVRYSAGAGVGMAVCKDPRAELTVEDYKELLEDEEADYQMDALEKAEDWYREVSVYTFSDIEISEEHSAWDVPVVGVAAEEDADILTYGFDYSSGREDGVWQHCFFADESERTLMLIVTGNQEREPQLGYYANLDCEEEISGISCEMEKQTMTYGEALRLCGKAMLKQLREEYGQGAYQGALPPYLDNDMMYQALTSFCGEEAFYDTVAQQYHTVNIQEAYTQLLAETRVVYAMAMATVPAGGSIRITANLQKRQPQLSYAFEESTVFPDEAYGYDFLPDGADRLHIRHAALSLVLPEGWKVLDETANADGKLAFEKKKNRLLAEMEKKAYHLQLSPATETAADRE